RRNRPWVAFIAVFSREQTPAYTAVSLHLGVGGIPTAMAPNRPRSSRAFSGRNDAGPRRSTHRREKWTQPLCSSSSSSWCCLAAADSSTDAGLESKGRPAKGGRLLNQCTDDGITR